MSKEVELKLLFTQKHQNELINFFNNLKNSQLVNTNTLQNRYFDTADLALRAVDMGLRVRCCEGQSEQTIKTKGNLMGGLHSRLEYNVNIQGGEPQLSLFPEQIWRNTNINVDNIQQHLQCLFNTDFERTTWHVSFNNSVIEIAIDIGDIVTRNKKEKICELELELLSGEARDLIELAIMVAKDVPVRLGYASKAKRGYKLASMASAKCVSESNLFHYRDKLSYSELLTHWQMLDEAMDNRSIDKSLYCDQLQQLLMQISHYQEVNNCNDSQSLLSYIEKVKAANTYFDAKKLREFGLLQLRLMKNAMAE